MIIANKRLLVQLERKLVISNCSGETKWVFKEVSFPNFAELLQDDLLLVEGSKSWYMICLKSGQILWSIAHSKRGLASFSHAVIDHNNQLLWRLYSRDCTYYLENLDIERRSIRNYRIFNYSGALQSIIIDSSGEPLVLNFIMVGEDTDRRQKNTIMTFEFSNGKAKAIDQSIWYDPNGIKSALFLGGHDKVLTSDLQIYHIGSGRYEPWLAETGMWTAPSPWGIMTADFDKMRNLAYLRYNHADVIVDMVLRTVISQYSVNDSFGTAAFGKYWYYTSEGIKNKEFPLFEQVSAPKPYLITAFNDVTDLHLEI